MRLVLLTAALGGALIAGAAFAQSPPATEQRNPCAQGGSRTPPGCPSLRAGPGLAERVRRAERIEEWNAVLAKVQAAVADERCEDARRIAVDEGRHELAARIRRAC